MEEKKNSKKILSKQKKLLYSIVGGFALLALVLVSFTENDEPEKGEKTGKSLEFDTVSKEVDPEEIRLHLMEKSTDAMQERLESLEDSLKDLADTNALSLQKNQDLLLKVEQLEQEKQDAPSPSPLLPSKPLFQSWGRIEKKEERHVSFEIPAGTVLKAVLVSGADCSVAVSKPTGPNMMLLRPLSNGQLPRNVRVPLKGSVIIANAIGDINSERVYIRAERMTLVEKNGAFNETEISAYVSGEDGREGMRGVVVDRSGKIITRAAFAAFFHGIGQAIESVLHNQSVKEHINSTFGSKDEEGKSSPSIILNADTFGHIEKGTSSAVGKLSDYYIKRAEQLQPAIQIAAGRVVDVVFTKSVRFGEKDLKKKFELQRKTLKEQL